MKITAFLHRVIILTMTMAMIPTCQSDRTRTRTFTIVIWESKGVSQMEDFHFMMRVLVLVVPSTLEMILCVLTEDCFSVVG